MIIRLYDFDFNNVISLDEVGVVSLLVENERAFSDMVGYFKGRQTSKKHIAVFEKEVELVYQKDYETVIDFYDYETVSKNVTGKAMKHLSEYCVTDDELSRGILKKAYELYAEVENLLNDFDIEFDSSADCSFEDLFKLFSVAPAKFKDSLIDKYLNFIEITAKLKLYKLLVFINARSVFTKNEIKELQKAALYKNVKMLFIENRSYDYSLESEDEYLIDKDLFLTKR